MRRNPVMGSVLTSDLWILNHKFCFTRNLQLHPISFVQVFLCPPIFVSYQKKKKKPVGKEMVYKPKHRGESKKHKNGGHMTKGKGRNGGCCRAASQQSGAIQIWAVNCSAKMRAVDCRDERQGWPLCTCFARGCLVASPIPGKGEF